VRAYVNGAAPEVREIVARNLCWYGTKVELTWLHCKNPGIFAAIHFPQIAEIGTVNVTATLHLESGVDADAFE
jgi:hypothetical protein